MAQTFEELIGSYLDGLYSAALCFTADEHRAEELLQEAAIRAFHQYLGRRWPSDFRQSMLEMLVTTYLERERRLGRDPLSPQLAPPHETADGSDGRDVEAFPLPGTNGYALMREWLSRNWPRLDDGDRLVLWLADVERIRHPRVAEMIGIDEQQVRSRHYRARRVLSRGAARELARRRASAEEVG